jgi:hypothetical protein
LNKLDPQVKALLEQFRANAAQHPAPATPLSVQQKIVASRHLRCLVYPLKDQMAHFVPNRCHTPY